MRADRRLGDADALRRSAGTSSRPFFCSASISTLVDPVEARRSADSLPLPPRVAVVHAQCEVLLEHFPTHRVNRERSAGLLRGLDLDPGCCEKLRVRTAGESEDGSAHRCCAHCGSPGSASTPAAEELGIPVEEVREPAARAGVLAKDFLKRPAPAAGRGGGLFRGRQAVARSRTAAVTATERIAIVGGRYRGPDDGAHPAGLMESARRSTKPTRSRHRRPAVHSDFVDFPGYLGQRPGRRAVRRADRTPGTRRSSA